MTPHRCICLFAVVLSALSLSLPAQAQFFPADVPTFPADDAFIAITCANGVNVEANDDTPGLNADRDLVGDVDNPASFFTSDLNFFYLRMRLDQSPAQGAGLSSFGWGLMLNRNVDTTPCDGGCNEAANPGELCTTTADCATG